MNQHHTFVIFAYAGNADLVPNCIRSVRGLRPEAGIVIAAESDGGAYPEGVHVVRTVFDRMGNLKGKAAILGVLDTMIENAGNADLVWKLDPDTLLLWDTILNTKGHPLAGYVYPSDYAGILRPGVPLLGCCYGMAPDLAKATRAVLLDAEIPTYAPEDVAITVTAHDLTGGDRHVLPCNASLPWAMHFWRWAAPLPIERYKAASAVNVGNPGGTREQQIELGSRLIDQMPTCQKSLPVAVQMPAKTHRQPLDVVEARVAIQCDKRQPDGICGAGCASCRGNPTCRQLAEWKTCPEKHW